MLLTTITVFLEALLYHSWNTNKGDYPWLCIDLEQDILVSSIAIFNTYDNSRYQTAVWYTFLFSIQSILMLT